MLGEIKQTQHFNIDDQTNNMMQKMSNYFEKCEGVLFLA